MAVPGTWYRAFLDTRDSSSSSSDNNSPQQQQQEQQQEPRKIWPEPPVLFVHMTRDEHTAARVQESVEIRRAKVGCEHSMTRHSMALGMAWTNMKGMERWCQGHLSCPVCSLCCQGLVCWTPPLQQEQALYALHMPFLSVKAVLLSCCCRASPHTS